MAEQEAEEEEEANGKHRPPGERVVEEKATPSTDHVPCHTTKREKKKRKKKKGGKRPKKKKKKPKKERKRKKQTKRTGRNLVFFFKFEYHIIVINIIVS